MCLYGPDSAETVLEYDNDDGGGGFSAITRVLSAGTYYVRITAWDYNETIESYSLSLTAE